MSDPGGVRASDAEREAVVEQLKWASVEGRLTLSELTERTEAAYGASTHAQLELLTADLPLPGPGAVRVPSVGEPVRKRKWFVAVMGDSKRRGKWRIDSELGAVAVMGDVLLDLREAEVRTNEVEIVATAVMGDIKIIVPDGVDVEIEGVAIMGDKKVRVQEAQQGMDVPVVRVKAFVLMGDVKVLGDSQAEPIRRGVAHWRSRWHELMGTDPHEHRRLDPWTGMPRRNDD
ncbi:DUF1707 domain-containing protein [Nonomuraea sp. NPDC050556]|uniref:DUF1707 SHOCT-like domain-containing protein n=1 Tax=Nonomuraea sp. NPDC050556 TaxID=3364369 RepID=UPI00379E40FF